MAKPGCIIRPMTGIFIMLLIVFSGMKSQAQEKRYMGEALFEGTMDEYQMGRYEEAVVGFKKFLDFAPNDFNGHYLLAHSLRFLGRYDEAIDYYEKALTIKPSDYDAHIYVGILYRDKADYEKAKAHFTKAHEILPRDPEAVVNLGVVEKCEGDIPGAFGLFEEAEILDPDFLDTYIQAAETYRGAGDYSKASQWIGKALAKNGTSFNVLMEAGLIGETADDYASAERYYLNACDVSPDSPLPYEKLAALYEKKGLADKAREYKERAAANASKKKRR